MSGLLRGLEEKIEKSVQKRMGPIVLKLEEMIAELKKIEKNTRKEK